MGNSQSYSLLAIVQWYSEGSRIYGSRAFEVKKRLMYKSTDLADMNGKVVVVTGANQGE